MPDRISELVKDAIVDATQLVHSETDVAKGELERTAVASVSGTGLSAAGLMTAVFGCGLLLVAPVVPARHRQLRGRLLAASLLYLGGGALAVAWGVRTLEKAVHEAFSRTVDHVEVTGRAFEHELEHPRTAGGRPARIRPEGRGANARS